VFFAKNTDASLLLTVSWPAFAIHEEKLVSRTIDKALRKLKGRFGLKRFLRDGYGTVLEDRARKYYRPAEIRVCLIVGFMFLTAGLVEHPRGDGQITNKISVPNYSFFANRFTSFCQIWNQI